VNIENPAAFSFIMQDEIYLLNKDKIEYGRPRATEPVITTPELSFNYLGGNKKKFLVVVHYPGLEFIAESHLAALENILKRLEFSLDDIAILNKAKYDDVTLAGLTDFFKPAKLLLLGGNALPDGIGVLSSNEPKQINSFNVLFTFSFDEMMDNQEYKKAFWEQMKKL
jgi:DNA polymerase III psi subunit